MSLSAAAIAELANAERSVRLVSGRDLRRMLEALEARDFGSSRATPLAKLCTAGVEYGWGDLGRNARSNLLSSTSARARANLRRHLQKRLERITRPCLELEWTSFKLAMNALGVPSSDASLTRRMFLRERPWDRLVLLFQKFPVLANLWCLTISQWRGHAVEVLDRVRKDGPALSRFFFSNPSNGAITNLRLGLSDAHNDGRSVALVEFRGGRRAIYKPRSGKSELAWFSLLALMNRNGFQPKLRTARVLLRKDYYWMEYVEPASCATQAAARRFYERMGALIAAAYLLKAVDCHRENVIAAGEHPVLVDIDALWHVSPLTQTQSPVDVLYRTGFFPTSRRKSLQSRSSVLGKTATGRHLARITGKPLSAGSYANEIIAGFSRAWDCMLGAPDHRAAFLRIVRRIGAQERRWIYIATQTYGTILRTSLQPFALHSSAAREALIRRSCARNGPGKGVIQAEVKALRQLDIPYFSRRTKGWMPPDKGPLPSELTRGIRKALQWTED
jgi:lantibiotic modifying enzyme